MVKALVKKLKDYFLPPQGGEVEYKYYVRTGDCNQCGACCSGIALVHNSEVIRTVEAFDELKKHYEDYRHFVPVEEAAHGVVFRCQHLQEDNSCGIYLDRPPFCKKYPSEDTLLLGGQLSPDCSYVFEKKFQFNDVLENKAKLPTQALRRAGKVLV